MTAAVVSVSGLYWRQTRFKTSDWWLIENYCRHPVVKIHNLHRSLWPFSRFSFQEALLLLYHLFFLHPSLEHNKVLCSKCHSSSSWPVRKRAGNTRRQLQRLAVTAPGCWCRHMVMHYTDIPFCLLHGSPFASRHLAEGSALRQWCCTAGDVSVCFNCK